MATQQDKLEREIEKLNWEIKHLKRPIWKTPAGIAAMLAATVALAGTGVQYLNSTVDKKLAEIERLEIKRATLKLADEKTDAERNLAQLKEQEAQVAEDKARLDKQYAAVAKFFQDNPNIENAQALLNKLHKGQYPLNLKRNFKISDSLTAVVSGKLTDKGDLTLTIAINGFDKKEKREMPGYTITINDLQTNQEIASINTGKLNLTGKQAFDMWIVKWNKAFSFKLDESVVSRIFFDSQVSIAASKQ